MSYRVIVTRSAEKELDRIPDQISVRIEKSLQNLEINPRNLQTKKLKDSNFYRLRVGDYRVIYLIDDPNQIVRVEHIRHRKEAYR